MAKPKSPLLSDPIEKEKLAFEIAKIKEALGKGKPFPLPPSSHFRLRDWYGITPLSSPQKGKPMNPEKAFIEMDFPNKEAEEKARALGMDFTKTITKEVIVEKKVADPNLLAKTPSFKSGDRTLTYFSPKWAPPMKSIFLNPPPCLGLAIFGEQGCGKTTAAHHEFAEFTPRYFVQQCAKGMTIDNFLGDKDVAEGKSFRNKGQLRQALEYTKAHPKKYGLMVFEEPNAAPEGIYSVLNNLLDFSGGGISLADGTILEPGPGFRCLFLYNEGYSGMEDMNKALLGRCLTVHADYPPPKIESQMLKANATVTLNTEECDRMVKVASEIRAAHKAERLDLALSIRQLYTWAGLVKGLNMSWMDAYSYAVVDQAGGPGALNNTTREVLITTANNAGVPSW